MKTKKILTILVICLLTVATSTAQELTTKAIDSWRTIGNLKTLGKACDNLIKNGTLKSIESNEKIDGPMAEVIILFTYSQKHINKETLIGKKNEYTIITLVEENEKYGKPDFTLFFSVSKDDVVCHFYPDGTIKLIEFTDENVWSPEKTPIIEDIQKFINELGK